MNCKQFLMGFYIIYLIHAIKADLNAFGSHSVLDPKGHLQFSWIVDYDKSSVSFKVNISRKVEPFNWFAVGFSDRGEFVDADLCLLWVDYLGHTHFDDTYTDNTGKIKVDHLFDCKHFYLDEKRREIGFERSFDTCDQNDYKIEDGTTHILWAYGPDTLYTAEGLQPSREDNLHHGFTRVRLLLPRPSSTTKEAQKLEFKNKNLKVPSKDTTYWCKVFKLPRFVRMREHHIVQYQPSITEGNEGLVHHMEIFYCDADRSVQIPLYEGSCFSATRPNMTMICSKVKAAWAMGATSFTYPKLAGLSLGGAKANQYVMLEVHYNNPEKRSDWIDSSGITFLVTSKLRKYNAAIMELGLEYTDKMIIPPGVKNFTLDGYCVSECTGVGIPSSGIIVFGSQLHTHLTGVRVETRHFRNGRELPLLNQDKHYSTHFQEIRILRRPVLILPGDLLITSCVYNTLERVNATVGGHAITDEMCVNYLHYYPAAELEVCKSSVSSRYLQKYFTFENKWEGMDISPLNSPRKNYLNIKPWNNLRLDALQTLYRESPIDMQCNKSDGSRFQGSWNDMLVPKVNLHRTEETKTVCEHH